MQDGGRVSIITACYNGERFIDTYVQSILGQTYQDIEVWFIDDGSTDSSAVRIKSYLSEFECRGIFFYYFYQANQGQAVATNAGLERMRGKYFSLFDIDDQMESDCIEKRVSFLEKHPDCGMVRSNMWKIYEENPDKKMQFFNKKSKVEDWIFEDVLENRISAFPIFYLFRTSAFFYAYPKGKIYGSRYTQDVQIVLPIAFYFHCGFIDSCLGSYFYHKGSHSHSAENALQKLQLWHGWENVWLETLKIIRMKAGDREEYNNCVKKRILSIKQFLLLETMWDNLLTLPEEIYKKNYIIFGASNEGRSLLQLLQGKGLHVVAFLDNDYLKQGLYVDNVKVIGIDDLPAIDDMYILIASSMYRREIELQLQKYVFITEANYDFYQEFIFSIVAKMQGWRTQLLY